MLQQQHLLHQLKQYQHPLQPPQSYLLQQTVFSDGSSSGKLNLTGTAIITITPNHALGNYTDQRGNIYTEYSDGHLTYQKMNNATWSNRPYATVEYDLSNPIFIGADTIDGQLTYHLRGAPIIQNQGVDETNANYGTVDLWIRADNLYIQKFQDALADSGVEQLGYLSGSINETDVFTKWNSGLTIPPPTDLPQ